MPSASPPRGELRDAPAILALCAIFAALTALTWRKWGVPEIDAGAELTTADLVKHGAVAYRDVRYYYGPLGLYSLALAFRAFGTSFTTAYAFGLAQAAAITAAFYALARHWLPPLTAGLASAMVLAIGFSGTAFDFVLPHTDSATFGLLLVLLTLLALAHGRLLRGGRDGGSRRPDAPGVRGGGAGGAGGVHARDVAHRRAAARRCARRGAWRCQRWRSRLAVLGWFAWRVGAGTLVSENLWPAKFVARGREDGARLDAVHGVERSRAWRCARASTWASLAALVKSAEAWRAARRGSDAGGHEEEEEGRRLDPGAWRDPSQIRPRGVA